MFGTELIKNAAYVPIPPQDLNDAAVASNWISMRDYEHATVFVSVGDTAGATFALTLDQATDNAGTGSKTLNYTKLYSTGQKLLIGTVSGAFSVGETVTGGTSSRTAEVTEIASTYLIVRCLTGGTTWTDGETLTGGTSAATAVLSGTGQDEDILVETYTAPSSTFTVPAVEYKTYVIEIDGSDLDVANGFDHFQVDLADPGTATIAGGCVILSRPRYRSYPMPSTIGTKKITSTVT